MHCPGVVKLARFALALGLLMWVVDSARADTYVGKVVTSTEGKLVMKDQNATEHTFVPDKETEITLNGQTATLDQLMPGFGVTVTTEMRNQRTVVVAIEAESDNERSHSRADQ